MSVFKDEKEFKRVIFNVENSLAERLERAKESARIVGKKLDVDAAVDKALEKYLKKAEKKLIDMLQEQGEHTRAIELGAAALDDEQAAQAGQESVSSALDVKKDNPVQVREAAKAPATAKTDVKADADAKAGKADAKTDDKAGK